MTPEKPAELIENAARDPGSRDRFSLLSHDLRAALTDVLGGLRLVDRERLDPETLAHFDRVNVSGETLARLLDKTLTDDPLEREQTVTRAANVNLREFLRDTEKRWSAHAQEVGISFEINCAASLPAIITLDRVSLERVIANLVGNAIKFTDAGQVVMSVACQPDQSLRFKIEDCGPGFSGDALARLFEYEGRPTGTAKPGTGLGLFIAKELSDLLEAQLDIKNRFDDAGNPVGAVAELTLPHESWFDRSLRRDAKPSDPQPDEPVDLSGLRILLAEDNKTNQLVATQMLRAMGADYAVASDGLEALDMLENEVFDLALLDIEMPRMTGLELIKTVRAMAAPVSEMPLVALTAYVMREHRERIYAAGATGIIAKPVMSISEMGIAILEYLNGAKSRMQVVPTQSAGADLPPDVLIDRAVFDTLIETIGAESMPELLGKLQADTDSVAEGLGRGRHSLDLAEIRSQTHILISVAGAIGARPLQLIAQRLNSAANRQEASDVDELCGACLSGLRELQGFILDEQTKIERYP